MTAIERLGMKKEREMKSPFGISKKEDDIALQDINFQSLFKKLNLLFVFIITLTYLKLVNT